VGVLFMVTLGQNKKKHNTERRRDQKEKETSRVKNLIWEGNETLGGKVAARTECDWEAKLGGRLSGVTSRGPYT
jgi:hypothetical protein